MTTSLDNDSLDKIFADNLPANHTFSYYHISTPPTKCAALFSPPPGSKPEITYCQSHFLLVSAVPSGSDAHEIAIFAIEVLLYSTAKLTTLFVSKADSTGWLSLLDLSKTFESPIRSITTQFTSFLARQHHRPGRRLVISLFARSQASYLFPGSPENKAKHILNDRQLVKWWCRSLDPVFREYPPDEPGNLTATACGIRTRAYLIVPGHDKYETSSFFPPSTHNKSPNRHRWTDGHPLYAISSFPQAPPRCIIPHFPDDPKARFLLDLDDEIRDVPTGQASNTISPSKRGTGQWKSVRNVDQFWDMMAFRTECSSGRLVGFIWITFTPPPHLPKVQMPEGRPSMLSSPRRNVRTAKLLRRRPAVARGTPANRKLKGPIISRAPRLKTSGLSDAAGSSYAEKTRHYYSPRSARGTLVLSQKGYTRLIELLLRLDFANEDVARSGTSKWIREAAVIAGKDGHSWGNRVIGRKIPSSATEQSLNVRRNGDPAPLTNTLSVKKKRKAESDVADQDDQIKREITHANGATLDRGGAAKEAEIENGLRPGIRHTGPNILGHGTVRKKPKVQ